MILMSGSLLVSSCGGSESSASAEEAAATEPAAPVTNYREQRQVSFEKGLKFPESVASDGETYYVSNLGGRKSSKRPEPTKKDKNGYIAKFDADGNLLEGKFISGLHAPKGMVLIGDRLYVTDIDKVYGYDVTNGEKVTEIPFEGGVEFLNDIAEGPDGTLFVTATDKNAIYQLTLGEEPKIEQIETTENIPSPNGITYDAEANALYVVSYAGPVGRVFKVDLVQTTPKVSYVTKHEGQLDGVVKIGAFLLTTDWNSQSMWLLDITDTNAPREHPMAARISGPADFYYDQAAGEFWIPAMLEDKVYIQTYALRP